MVYGFRYHSDIISLGPRDPTLELIALRSSANGAVAFGAQYLLQRSSEARRHHDFSHICMELKKNLLRSKGRPQLQYQETCDPETNVRKVKKVGLCLFTVRRIARFYKFVLKVNQTQVSKSHFIKIFFSVFQKKHSFGGTHIGFSFSLLSIRVTQFRTSCKVFINLSNLPLCLILAN